MNDPTEIWALLARLESSGEPFVCATLVASRGSTPQEIGAKVVVTAAGRLAGTVGGGRVEQKVVAAAKDFLKQPSGEACPMLHWNLQRDVGMTCGGEVTFLLEIRKPMAWRIAIFGAGHVSQALTRVLSRMSCRIDVHDSRQDWLDALPKLPNVHAHCADSLAEAVDQLPEGAFVALMTQGHKSDSPILERILKTRQFPYLGVIGSKSKAATLRREMREAGLPEDRAGAFRCPLGLPIGRDTPEEIALSIAAEMLQVRGS